LYERKAKTILLLQYIYIKLRNKWHNTFRAFAQFLDHHNPLDWRCFCRCVISPTCSRSARSPPTHSCSTRPSHDRFYSVVAGNTCHYWPLACDFKHCSPCVVHTSPPPPPPYLVANDTFWPCYVIKKRSLSIPEIVIPILLCCLELDFLAFSDWEWCQKITSGTVDWSVSAK
jgi:hypothetical protein